MLRDRLLTAAVALPLLLYLIFWAPFWAYRTVVLGFTILSLVEYFTMAFPTERAAQAWGVGCGALVALAIGSGAEEGGRLFSGVLMAVVTIGLVGSVLTPGEPQRNVSRFGTLLVGVLYAGAFLPHLVWLRMLDSGAAWVLFVLAVGMGGDTAGYFAGRFLGRRLLMPAISPKKTVEGAVGALGGNLVAGVLVKALLLPGVGWLEVVLLAAAAGCLAQVGDLCESQLKRSFGAKDSSHLLPGHGGVLDRTDSLVFPTVLVYYYVSFLRVAS